MRRVIIIISLLILLVTTMAAQGQITIGGNVYGGGNAGDLNGSTNVTVYAGEINEVYGGARQADVAGRTFVHLNGKYASDDIFVKNVYGGNDIAGTIGEGSVITTVPDSLENIWKTDADNSDKTKNKIDNTWKSFVRTSACTDKVTVGTTSIDARMLVVGNLFGGSNGDYDYTSGDAASNPYYGKSAPELSKAYLEIKGGCIAHVYGGGNNATVTEATTIHIENTSDDLEKGGIVFAAKKGFTTEQQLTAYFQSKVHMSTFQSNLTSWAFNHARVFGGNNKAPMYIMPKWNLQKGIIRDLYSGGNEGAMHGETGLLLEIDPAVDPVTHDKNGLVINNVYGGCRRADVRPMKGGQEIAAVLTDGAYKFPKGLSARTLVRGGKITNVYGGNDISGKVVGGNAVGIYSDILGDVYGGGNGSYAYTDNTTLGGIEGPKDFFYSIPDGKTSAEALNDFRPNAEQVSIRLAGTEGNPVTIWGSVYVGGNSATLTKDPTKIGNPDYPKYPVVELKIGSYVTANNVFLGNNGENMIKCSEPNDALKLYSQYVDNDLNFTDMPVTDRKYSTMDLTNKNIFAEYMNGCAMDMIPNVVFDNGAVDPASYKDYSSYFGSFYCGGNVGSMIGNGLTKIDFDKEVVIFNKFVGGCNNANVEAVSGLRAEYRGGVTGTFDSDTGNKIELNLSGLRIQPKRWNDVYEAVANGTTLIPGNTYYTSALGAGEFISEGTEVADGTNYFVFKSAGTELVWNTVDGNGDPTEPVTSGTTFTTADLTRRFRGGNIYGGCYSSGRVNGNVVINLNGTIVERGKKDTELEPGEVDYGVFDEVAEDSQGEAILYNHDNYTITKRRSGVILGQQGMDVFGKSLNVFGGGKGKDTEIWGSTTVNLNAGYTFQIFGGSEEGVIGKSLEDNGVTVTEDGENTTKNYDYVFNGKHYAYSPAYSCYVNLKGDYAGVTKTNPDNSPLMADCEFMYGGGFFGPICGNTVINMGKGRIFNSFAGSCMADILGHTETYIGRMVKDEYQNTMGKLGSTEGGLDNDTYYEEGFPWVRDITYGGNDLGGKILGVKDYKHRVRSEALGKVYNPGNKANADVLTASAYTEYLQGRADAIFGGCYGTYDYTESRFRTYFNADGTAKDGYSKPRMDNAFVNFRPSYSVDRNGVGKVYGAGQGYSGEPERDVLQDRSYILIDIPNDMTYYKKTEVFGAGAWGGVGMREYLPAKSNLTPEKMSEYMAELDENSAIIDLVRGQLGAAYGGSYKEGVTRRSLVNVPTGSTITMGSIFGGAYGTNTYMPCDVYESNVNYHSSTAKLIYNPGYSELYQGNIYGGNNNERRTFYGHVTIDAPVVQDKVIQRDDEIKGMKEGQILTTTATIFGAGRGTNTWNEYTEVNLNSGAEVYEVYGGGQDGKVFNAESVTAFMNQDKPTYTWPDGTLKAGQELSNDDWAAAWVIGGGTDSDGNGYDPATGKEYWECTNTNLANPLVRVARMDDRDFSGLSAEDLALVQNRYSTNVIINRGATVNNYAYGGGLGTNAVVSGTTYITLLGGTVKKDVYAAGTSGSVRDAVATENYSGSNRAGFMASANVYIESGTCRNVYGGGWEGSVGKHTKLVNQKDKDGYDVLDSSNNPVKVEVEAAISDPWNSDILGETHVVIGKRDGTSLYDGIPAVQRNVYGGGEGGPVFGTSNVTIRNGYIGYAYNPETSTYEEKLDDETWTDHVGAGRLYDSGCVFGGGYIDNSSVDFTNIKMYGGHVRNSLFGGGEIAAVGRGECKETGDENKERALKGIYKGGSTFVDMFGGHVLRNVFGGGRGYDNLGKVGHLYTDGYVFGKTDVHVHGGEVGTEEGMENPDTRDKIGNVFGGGDVGYVYSAYEYKDNNGVAKLGRGMKSGKRYNDDLNPGDIGYDDEGYYYRANVDTKDSQGEIVPVFETDPETNEKLLTEDCKVLIEPHCRVKSGSVAFTGIHYPKDAILGDNDIAYLNSQGTTGFDENGKVTAENGITFSRSYSEDEYVSCYALNTLKDKNSDSRWGQLDDDGIIVHNAVFAGGNVTEGSDQIYANATTVFGNATASIHDVYHRDLITIGTGHTGGLYGDGNLTFVDGYRGLNITNYGTDYYNISMEIGIDDYRQLPAREQAYYELRYSCLKECVDIDGKTYTPANGNIKASTITADELLVRFEGINTAEGTPMIINGKPDSKYWKEEGVCSRYAGRIMNTIQRADFCGVFGSRMVMQGAKDRVPEEVDNANYTINRVREVSLNKKVSVAGDTEPKHQSHGNYFGIYSIVNHLGALTSDVDFHEAVRTTNNTESTYAPDNSTQTFAQWKDAHVKERKRNNGTSHNQVALASGVYLELTTEKSWGKGVNEKVWGLITGVVELDLINVQSGIGGGFVYAKNEHGVRSKTNKQHITLTALNSGAVTKSDFTYDTSDATKKEWETSGNFVHGTQTIIDDCYPESNRYKGASAVLAHYWYIKGQVYIYDQYISAYTGAPNAYSRVEYIPLTITAASHGEMKLMNIKPNRYAYYSSYTPASGSTPASGTKLTDKDELTIGEKTYKLNDPISYWDYNLLTPAEQRLFVEKTYVTVANCKIGDTVYPAGTVMLPSDKDELKTASSTQRIDGVNVKAVIMVDQDENGNYVERKDDADNNIYGAFDFVFRESNNMSHNRGYILTYEVTNPKIWDKWYTPAVGAINTKITAEEYEQLTSGQDAYHNGPTYRPTTAGLYGQQTYKIADIIPEATYTTYQSVLTGSHAGEVPSGQASFEEAYIVTKEIAEATKTDGTKQHLNVGATLVKSDYYNASSSIDNWTELAGSVEKAYVCTNTIKLGENNYIYINQVMSATEKGKFKTDYTDLASDIEELVTEAYYCTSQGLYGGDYYETTKNYRGLEAWSSMSEEDRQHFTFNYDALDVLVDSTYSRAEGEKYQYDGNYTTEEAVRNTTTGNKAGYSVTQPVDYTATYDGDSSITGLSNPITVKRGNNTISTTTVQKGDELERTVYESLPNERRHYAPISVSKDGGTYYVVKEAFIHGETPYAVGQVVGSESYASLGSDQDNITALTFGSDTEDKTYYYCRESYEVGHNGEGANVTGVANVGAAETGSYGNGQEVPVGLVITDDNYSSLANRQLNFMIHGVSPIETSTLYVSRESDIFDLSTEKIITVVYEYNYEESDEQGLHITPVSERHVLNIHILFESGVPEVEDISKPKIILPGTEVSLRTPNVKPGAYEVTGGGWMLFKKYSDTESHINGVEYTPTDDPLYWYQDGYWVAYYAKTYLGKTFSNAVQVSVANYHDLHDVMSEKNKEHHMYVDHPEVRRDSKIYINDYSNLSDNDDPRKTQNGLDLLKDFFDLSILSSSPAEGTTLEGHALLNNHVRAGEHLEFFLRSDLDHTGSVWMPIGESTCFEGTLHGDGHTISGLTPNLSATTEAGKTGSLFSKLCGNVYNLGVTGSFTGAGIADEGSGYMENCWVKTTGTPASGMRAVFGNPNRGSGTQVVNCYYPVSNAFSDSDNGRGIARKMPDKAFYNGEVAYDLNGFYLHKRYYDGTNLSTGTEYNYLRYDDDGTLPENALSANYPDSYAIYQPENVTANPAPYMGYVENRYYDGDFQYAGKSVPEEDDRRMRKATVSVTTGTGASAVTTDVETDVYYPIWPDDYLFFGQNLNYGHVEGRTHQETPSRYTSSNRVYRAPAYFQDSKMNVAHFNPDAVFAQTKNGDASVIAYKNMTAIDFTGYNDQGYQSGVITAAPYNNTLNGAFFPPLLDDDGLTGFQNVDLTRNLLVYTGMPGTSAAGKTGTVVSTYLPDEPYGEIRDDYHTVAPWDSPSDKVKGHWVQYDGSGYTASLDHVLVDKQDFNAPISYTFDDDYRMWYQRMPVNYVGKMNAAGTAFINNNAGWECVSLPFKAELVTTDVKGEITHFYSGSKTVNGDTKIGHEYWLREFNGGAVSSDSKVFEATFNYPQAKTADGKKEFTNTFLWDYYYSYKDYKDGNSDKYQENDEYNSYYRYPRTHKDYPRLAAATPYIIGFPGERYYEFDLSGAFKVSTAYIQPDKLGAQTITFASLPGTTIEVSDTEIATAENKDGYTFVPNYLSKTPTGTYYTMNADGDKFVGSEAGVVPFRPYFIAGSLTSSAPATRGVQYIVFDDDESSFAIGDEDPTEGEVIGGLLFGVRNHAIVVTSSLRKEADVRIVNAKGQTIASFDIKPGESIETPVRISGVYIIRAAGGHYTKKITVK